MPTDLALVTGTRRVILSFSNSMMNSSRLTAGDFLLLDARDLADAMGGIDDMVVGLELVLLVRVGRDFLGGAAGAAEAAEAAALVRGFGSGHFTVLLCDKRSSGRRGGGRRWGFSLRF